MPPKTGRPFRLDSPASSTQTAAAVAAVMLLVLLAATTRTASPPIAVPSGLSLSSPAVEVGRGPPHSDEPTEAHTVESAAIDPSTADTKAVPPATADAVEHEDGGVSGCGDKDWATGATIVGNRPVGTYLCSYFPEAEGIRNGGGGCRLACPASAAAPLGYRDGPSAATFPCTIMKKALPAALRTADVVVNHHGPVPKQLHPGQVTLFYSGESNHSEGKKANATYQRQYTHVVSFHRWRPFHFTWTHRFFKDFTAIANGERAFPDPPKLDAIVVFVSRCGKGGRDGVIKALANAYTVHSFGNCVRTHTVLDMHPECENKGSRYKEKLCVFSKYRFALTLDNSREEDYVTEKVYHALVAGPVPIYDGAPNVDDFLPDPKSIIRLGDFVLPDAKEKDFRKNPKSIDTGKLIAKLKSVAQQGAKAPELAWRSMKTDEWPEAFRANLLHPEPTCSICAEAVFRRCKARSP